jgi:hypothetical protein
MSTEDDVMSERSAKEVVAEMVRRQQAGDDTGWTISSPRTW